MADIGYLIGAFMGTFLLSRLFWLIAWKWPNSMTKAVVVNVVSALVIGPGDYLARGNPKNLLNSALLYGGCQFLVFLIDLIHSKPGSESAKRRFDLIASIIVVVSFILGMATLTIIGRL